MSPVCVVDGLLEPIIDANFEIFEGFELYDIPELDDDPKITYDIMKQKRVGYFASYPGSYLRTGTVHLKYYATPENTGPDYLH